MVVASRSSGSYKKPLIATFYIFCFNIWRCQGFGVAKLSAAECSTPGFVGALHQGCYTRHLCDATLFAVHQRRDLSLPAESANIDPVATAVDNVKFLPVGFKPTQQQVLYVAHFNETLTFPISVADLVNTTVVQRGEFISTEPFTLRGSDGSEEEYDFCVKLYPRGTSKRTPVRNRNWWLWPSRRRRRGFGMSYASSIAAPIFPFSNTDNDKHDDDEVVYVYLQFLPRSIDQTVDASFALRLLSNTNGNKPPPSSQQQQKRRVQRTALEWRAGMRFVHADNLIVPCRLAHGRASDFGAPLLRTNLLSTFLLGVPYNNSGSRSCCTAVVEEEGATVSIHVELNLHMRPSEDIDVTAPAIQQRNSVRNSRFFSLRDIRKPSDEATTTTECHDTEQVRVGRVVVPVLQRLSQRPGMFQQGVYPGVEYRILRIHQDLSDGSRNSSGGGTDLFYSQPGAQYDLKPMYPLVAELERLWPITVNERDIPLLYTPAQYNAVSAIGSLLTAATGLLMAFLISQAVSLYYIPSRSMDPTLAVGDVLLVEKISPRLLRLVEGSGPHTGDVVLFTPPARLQDIIAQSGGRVDHRALFVKRIAAEPGDRVTVDPMGGVEINNGNNAVGRLDLCDADPLGLIQRFLPSTTQQTIVQPGMLEVLGIAAQSRSTHEFGVNYLRKISLAVPLYDCGPCLSLDRFLRYRLC